MSIAEQTSSLLGHFSSLLAARAEAARAPEPSADIRGAAKLDTHLALAVRHIQAAREEKVARARSRVTTALGALSKELAGGGATGADVALARKVCEVVTEALAEPDLPAAR